MPASSYLIANLFLDDFVIVASQGPAASVRRLFESRMSSGFRGKKTPPSHPACGSQRVQPPVAAAPSKYLKPINCLSVDVVRAQVWLLGDGLYGKIGYKAVCDLDFSLGLG
jgi:hypothetical protein